jgi:hypothetical protein
VLCFFSFYFLMERIIFCQQIIYTSQQKKRYKDLMVNIFYIEKTNPII